MQHCTYCTRCIFCKGTDLDDAGQPEGLRERKRRQTRQRIAEAALKLFGANGFETTTLDAIATAAGISRRTFFHYFRSKDDILVSLQTGLGERIVDALADEPLGGRPFETMRDVLSKIASAYGTDELLAMDRIMRSSEAVQQRKQASYIQDEHTLFPALRARWPDEPDIALRLLASLSITAVRLSIDSWSAEGGTRSHRDVLLETFAALEALSPRPASQN